MKLNLGSGKSVIPGFVSVDRMFGMEVYPLPYGDDTVDEIRASHVLEHFPHWMTVKVLEEWLRVLKPGGLLKVAVPNLEYACQNAGHPHFEGWIMGGQTDDNDYHEALFTRGKLLKIFNHFGVLDVADWTSEIQDCAALPVSLNLCGKKPAPPKIACALSMPRLGFNDNWGCIQAALAPWNIPVRRYSGVWWERSLQNVLEDLCDEGFDYAVTIDYDSMFTTAQFNSLLEAIKTNRHMDAVCPVQAKRGSQEAMFTPADRQSATTHEVKLNTPVAADTGHFGLTFIRLARLNGIRKPWFLNVPGKDGSWKREAEGMIDADIYFWNQWKAAGRTLFMLPWVSIGHIETLVSKIDVKAGGAHTYTHPKDWVTENFGKG